MVNWQRMTSDLGLTGFGGSTSLGAPPGKTAGRPPSRGMHALPPTPSPSRCHEQPGRLACGDTSTPLILGLQKPSPLCGFGRILPANREARQASAGEWGEQKVRERRRGETGRDSGRERQEGVGTVSCPEGLAGPGMKRPRRLLRASAPLSVTWE